MKWKEILKVDLREARMLGRKHAPEEMSAGKEKITIEKNIMSLFTDVMKHRSMQEFRNFRYQVRSGKLSEDVLMRGLSHSLGMDDVTIHSVVVKPQENRDRGDVANTLLDDPFPSDKAVITIKYSSPQNKNETFIFDLPPLKNPTRLPKTKKVRGGHRQRNPKQHIGFDRKEDM